MANKKQDPAHIRVKKFLAEGRSISEKIAEEELGIGSGWFRSVIYRLRQEGWDIKRESSDSIGSFYHLASTPDLSKLAQLVTVVPLRSYTPDEFRKILVILYGPMDDWHLAWRAAADFNLSQLRIYRWLQQGKPITGPAVPLADSLIGDHYAKTGRKP